MASKTEGIKAERVDELMNNCGYTFVHFKGGDLMSGSGTNGFVPFDSRIFGRLYQSKFSGASENMITDTAKTIKTISNDWSQYDHLIAFGDQVWDMKKLEFVDDQFQFVYSTRIKPNNNTKLVWKFLMELARDDKELAKDYLQSIAPIAMYRKPTGVVWFVGDGANGKSSLISALYRLIGDRHLASLTTAAIEDGKATPVLRGILGNICRESSESRVEDTERYKAIGTHEPFAVRQMYTQENITVETNFHTIFNANNVPVFSDKTKGARRRTLVVPFLAHFDDNPSFDDETFTDEFLGGLLTLILEETKVIRDNRYRYKWSDSTIRAKEAYDSEVNSAESYIQHIQELGVAGFYNYQRLKQEYDNWCAAAGMIPLGVVSLKRTLNQAVNPLRRAIRTEHGIVQRYFFKDSAEDDLVWLDNGYGMPHPQDNKRKAPAQAKLAPEW